MSVGILLPRLFLVGRIDVIHVIQNEDCHHPRKSIGRVRHPALYLSVDWIPISLENLCREGRYVNQRMRGMRISSTKRPPETGRNAKRRTAPKKRKGRKNDLTDLTGKKCHVSNIYIIYIYIMYILYVFLCLHIYLHIYIYVYMGVCMGVCMCVCTCPSIHRKSQYTSKCQWCVTEAWGDNQILPATVSSNMAGKCWTWWRFIYIYR